MLRVEWMSAQTRIALLSIVLLALFSKTWNWSTKSLINEIVTTERLINVDDYNEDKRAFILITKRFRNYSEL